MASGSLTVNGLMVTVPLWMIGHGSGAVTSSLAFKVPVGAHYPRPGDGDAVHSIIDNIGALHHQPAVVDGHVDVLTARTLVTARRGHDAIQRHRVGRPGSISDRGRSLRRR